MLVGTRKLWLYGYAEKIELERKPRLSSPQRGRRFGVRRIPIGCLSTRNLALDEESGAPQNHSAAARPPIPTPSQFFHTPLSRVWGEGNRFRLSFSVLVSSIFSEQFLKIARRSSRCFAGIVLADIRSRFSSYQTFAV